MDDRLYSLCHCLDDIIRATFRYGGREEIILILKPEVDFIYAPVKVDLALHGLGEVVYVVHRCVVLNLTGKVKRVAFGQGRQYLHGKRKVLFLVDEPDHRYLVAMLAMLVRPFIRSHAVIHDIRLYASYLLELRGEVVVDEYDRLNLRVIQRPPK